MKKIFLKVCKLQWSWHVLGEVPSHLKPYPKYLISRHKYNIKVFAGWAKNTTFITFNYDHWPHKEIWCRPTIMANMRSSIVAWSSLCLNLNPFGVLSKCENWRLSLP